jgi:hypothetical protein
MNGKCGIKSFLVAAEVRRWMILGPICAVHPPPHLGGYGSAEGALAVMKWQCRDAPYRQRPILRVLQTNQDPWSVVVRPLSRRSVTCANFVIGIRGRTRIVTGIFYG